MAEPCVYIVHSGFSDTKMAVSLGPKYYMYT